MLEVVALLPVARLHGRLGGRVRVDVVAVGLRRGRLGVDGVAGLMIDRLDGSRRRSIGGNDDEGIGVGGDDDG